jgi:hypothetical protein
MTVIEALGMIRKAIAQDDPAAVSKARDEAERLAAIAPEIAVHLRGGEIVEVSRANDAPYVLHVHDHDVVGDSASRLVWPDGSEEDAIISTHGPKTDETRTSEAYWDSLRNPVAATDCVDDTGEVEGPPDWKDGF